MAKFFAGPLSPGAERSDGCKKDDFEYPGMLCSFHDNRNGDRIDSVFVRDSQLNGGHDEPGHLH
jgi:hypothetical protein